MESLRKSQRGIAQEGKREVESVDSFLLVDARLGAQTKHKGGAFVPQFLVVITKSAGLWGASSGAWNKIPPVRKILVRASGTRITVDHSSPRQ
ncbi:hypothetical protein KSC_074340 [Ktedonobacter sp. SOSP1-52]|nr:hypothetical protein KSC_074340 [Ktedonobacter sp. SOSP1-52]